MASPESSKLFAPVKSCVVSIARTKFHAKAYITHARLEVVGSSALVGSANFTYPGLTENIELNVQVTGQPVSVLQEWYEEHWAEAEDVSEEILKTIERHTREYLPLMFTPRRFTSFFRGHEMTASEWEDTRSRMFSKLDRYQKEAYWALMKIARQHAGAFLCDGVGLGKTFVGLMLIERLILHEGKRVVLFAPKAAKEAVGNRICEIGYPTSAAWGAGAISATSRSSVIRTLIVRAIFPRGFVALQSLQTLC